MSLVSFYRRAAMKDPNIFVSIILFSITCTRHLMSFQVWMSWLRC